MTYYNDAPEYDPQAEALSEYYQDEAAAGYPAAAFFEVGHDGYTTTFDTLAEAQEHVEEAISVTSPIQAVYVGPYDETAYVEVPRG